MLLLAILLIFHPIVAGFVIVALKAIYYSTKPFNLWLNDFKSISAGILIYSSWSFLLYVLVPYGILHIYNQQVREGKLKLLLFYTLPVFMGILAPNS
jgi:hypothetical protein